MVKIIQPIKQIPLPVDGKVEFSFTRFENDVRILVHSGNKIHSVLLEKEEEPVSLLFS